MRAEKLQQLIAEQYALYKAAMLKLAYSRVHSTSDVEDEERHNLCG